MSSALLDIFCVATRKAVRCWRFSSCHTLWSPCLFLWLIRTTWDRQGRWHMPTLTRAGGMREWSSSGSTLTWRGPWRSWMAQRWTAGKSGSLKIARVQDAVALTPAVAADPGEAHHCNMIQFSDAHKQASDSCSSAQEDSSLLWETDCCVAFLLSVFQHVLS